jgi:hypothetical protein
MNITHLGQAIYPSPVSELQSITSVSQNTLFMILIRSMKADCNLNWLARAISHISIRLKPAQES